MMTLKQLECEEIAKGFCKKIGADFIYADEYSIGYELNGVLIKKYWNELESIVRNMA